LRGEVIEAKAEPLIFWTSETSIAVSDADTTRTRSRHVAELKKFLKELLTKDSSEKVIVFTEYRDTLTHLRQQLVRPALVLHGGLTRDERSAVLAEFVSGAARVLLATDAASEGLNLQSRCRLVVNLELPWNPMRLEQRIGRVDRIGQGRIVHAFHLVAASTGETRILERLRSRIATAGADVGAANPLDDEASVARFVITGDELDDHHER